MLTSSVCRYEHFLTGWYAEWSALFGLDGPTLNPRAEGAVVQRKVWEWCTIAQALQERDMLREGRSGCGFAVGQEPLPSAFAARGVEVLATDQPVETATEAWTATSQHASSLEPLYNSRLIDRRDFEERVRFRPVDMRDLRLPWPDSFDFVWSSCSLEHLGTLEAGVEFVLASMELVKPGGYAIHTTEFNVSSNSDTIGSGVNVLYRQCDLENLDRRLRARSCGVSRFDFFAGDDLQDIEFDYPPYFTHGRQHVKLLLDGYVTTSIVLIIRKGHKSDA